MPTTPAVYLRNWLCYVYFSDYMGCYESGIAHFLCETIYFRNKPNYNTLLLKCRKILQEPVRHFEWCYVIMQNTCIYEISNGYRKVSFDGSLPISAGTPPAVTRKILIEPRLWSGHRQRVTVNAAKKNENNLDTHICFDNTDMFKILKKNQRNTCKRSNLQPDMFGSFSIYYFTYVNYNRKEVLHI